uniref:Amiloride-sensitive sodium channel subunit alpha n=1 Tax=Syphacia muris TaxID=451379 RepID=A0A0N5A7T1_9BILA
MKIWVGNEDTFDQFNVPLEELERESKRVTTLEEQCRRFQQHYRYFCKTSNIAKYNEEVRIICERYEIYCSERVPATIDYIRRQREYWKHSGLPKYAENALVSCYASCRESDPLCVLACECFHMQWIMDGQCRPGARAPALPNCQRWYAKCKRIWRPRANLTPFPYGFYSPPPVVRGIFYGYDGVANHQIFDIPRKHGISFYRKVTIGSTFDVPFIGVQGQYNTYEIGFPNLATGLNVINRNQHLNPGTGR